MSEVEDNIGNPWPLHQVNKLSEQENPPLPLN
jgi:hypothetical protein